MPRSRKTSPVVSNAAVLLGLGIGLALVTAAGCKSTNGINGSSGLPLLAGTGSLTVTATGSANSGNYTVDFGNVAVGEDSSTQLTLANTGTSPLQILNVAAPTDAEFGINLAPGTAVQPGAVMNVPVDFKPFSKGAKSATIVVQTDSTTVQTVTLTMTGVGVDLVLQVDPLNVDFGNVVVHTTGSKTITLTNASDLDLQITPGAMAGPNAAIFNISQTTQFLLKAHTSSPIQATFAPVVASGNGAPPDTASFSLTLSTGSPVIVNLKGVATQTGLSVTPNPLDFNFVAPMSQLTLSLTLKNVGNQQINVSAITVTDPGMGQVFSMANGAPSTAQLASGQSIQVGVTFAPTSSQFYQGNLQIQSNDTLSVQNVMLQGYGGGANISCGAPPLKLDFGTAPSGYTTTLPVICTNTGTDVLVSGKPDPKAELTISSFEFQGGSGVFGASIDPQSPQGPLTAGQSVQVDVTYSPQMTETDSAALTIVSNVTNPPAPPVFALTGQAILEQKCYYSLTPTSLNWGQVKPGGSTYTQAFTITNLGPNECLVNAVNLLPGSDSAFTMTPVASARLSAPGTGGAFPTQLVVPVTFAPTTPDDFSGVVGFSISDPDGPYVRVPLAGTGANSCFLIKPAELNFGVVGLSNGQYCAKAKKSFVGINGCTTPVTITAVTLSTGTSTSPFAFITETVPVTVGAGQTSAPFLLGFKPTAAGSYYSSAQVQTDLSQNSFGVFFQGTAAPGDTQTDRFAGTTPKADILWVMDTDDDDLERTNVSGHAAEFVNALISDGLDFQIAVTSSDSCGDNPPPGAAEGGRILPCPNCKLNGSIPTIITADDVSAGPDLATLMVIKSQVSNSCQNDEHFFETTYEAFVSGAGATYNNLNNFVRPDAYLAVITVNHDDEDDNSRTNTPDYYATQFLSVKGADHPELFSWSYVNPSEYGAPGGHQPFNRLPERIATMLGLVGGVALDTTQENWWNGILDLWQIVLASNVRFPFSGTPVANTIQVYLDGPPPDQVTGGETPGVLLQASNPNLSWNWQYDPASNSLEVNPETVKLTAADTLYVTYTLGCN
jgi:hypothetical protein